MTEIKLLESPSSQKKYDRCRLLGQLQYIDRWEPREAERSLPARLRGTAFARGAEIIHKTIMQGEKAILLEASFLLNAVEESIALFDRQFSYCVNKGITFPPDVDAISRAELRRVIPLFARHTPVLQWQKVLGVEMPLKKWSCRPDVMGVNSLSFNIVSDVKYKTGLEPRYQANTIEEFHWDPQFLQYNHAWRDELGCGPDVPVYSGLILVIGSPFSVRACEWLYPPETMKLWLASAEDMSATIRGIKTGTVLPRAATTHKDNFGWCSMKKACLEYHLDPELMKRDYVQLDEMPE